MIAWCYPMIFWGLVAGLLVKLAQLCVADKGPRWLPLIGVAVTLIPIQGMPFGRFLHGITSGFSIPSFVLLMDVLWKAHSGQPLLSNSTRMTMYAAGTVFGISLYPMAIGLGLFDPYALGWSSGGLSILLILVTSVFLWKSSAFGYILLLAAAAWQIGLFESINIWDYVVDPAYFLSSLVVLIAHAVRAQFSGHRHRALAKRTTTAESLLRNAA